MALIDSKLDELESFVNEQLQLMNERIDYGLSLYESCPLDSNFSAWTTGTNFGKNFRENYVNLFNVAKELKKECENLHGKVLAFVNRQREINSSGK